MTKAKESSWWERWRLSFLMLLVCLLGVIIILVSYITLMTKHVGDWQLVHDIGVGFLVAGILGITVDQVLRRQLAKDAFMASVGYILPDELKGEMKWIYEAHILCTHHIQICELQPNPQDASGETCVMHVRTQRTFQNIGQSRSPIDLGVGIDEWFHKTGVSQILSFGYSKGEKKWPATEKEIHKTNRGWEIQNAPKESLAPKEELTTWHEIKEIKRTNDVNYWAFKYPTLNPQVTVKAYSGICINVGFGYRLSAEELGFNTYRLSGTLLPHQVIEIRWWKESDSENWLKGSS